MQLQDTLQKELQVAESSHAEAPELIRCMRRLVFVTRLQGSDQRAKALALEARILSMLERDDPGAYSPFITVCSCVHALRLLPFAATTHASALDALEAAEQRLRLACLLAQEQSARSESIADAERAIEQCRTLLPSDSSRLADALNMLALAYAT